MSTELAPASPEFTARFRRSAAAFRRFFEELAAHYLEREHVLAQIQLALLSREHVLVFGPPGTAKSELALNVVRRIVDDASGEASLFSKQIAETTVQTDIIGPVDYKTLTETGRTEHLTDEGILGAVHGVLDEVYDGRERMLRSILNVLQEREVKSGRKTVRGRNEVAIMTSNRYLSEVVQRNPELMLAFADRVAYVSFVPKGFAHRESRAAMLQRAARRMRPDLQARLTIQDVDILQEAAEAVEVPEGVLAGLERLAELLERELASHAAEDSAFLPTKYFSNRTLVRSLLALKAAVVRSATLAPRAWPLKASLDDLAHLQAFFTLAGPSVVDLAALQQAASDRREKVQLAISRTEAVAFAECLARTLQSMAGGQPFKARERKLG
ncbi:MAG: MoxR family ATPase [Deltaproteobacteria bacterium]|nr:MoxR family ATPase [Deltaproteobacteria bacterium]